MLPFVIAACGDDAAVADPVFTKGWFFGGSFDTGVNEERAGIVAPLHRKNRRLAVAVRRDDRREVGRVDVERRDYVGCRKCRFPVYVTLTFFGFFRNPRDYRSCAIRYLSQNLDFGRACH